MQQGEEYSMDLTIFDEGAGAAAESPSSAGIATSHDGAEAEAESTQNQSQSRDFDGEFDAFIKGEYKAQYDKRVQQIVKDRLKGSKEAEGKLKEAHGVLELIGERYGQDATDIKALRTAIESDKKYLEEEAFSKGISVEQLTQMKQLERENRSFKAQQEQALEREMFEEKFRSWDQEAEAIKGKYPALDLVAEFENPAFVRLLDSGVGVQAAYQAIHFDELLGGALEYTAKQAEKKVMDGVRANGQRPTENGTLGSRGVSTKVDVSKLTREQRREIAEQVMRDPERRNPVTF